MRINRKTVCIEAKEGYKYFRVMNIYDASNYSENNKHVVISITQHSYLVNLPKNDTRCDLLQLEFHDVNDKSLDGQVVNIDGVEEQIKCFSEEQAQQIVDFVKKNIDVNTYIIHCIAGISRSAGVAAAIAKCLGGSDEEFFKHYYPNSLVYNTILYTWFNNDQNFTYEKRKNLFTF